MNLRALQKLLQPLSRRIRLLAGRGMVLLTNSDTKRQTMQVQVGPESTIDDVEHFEPYGFTANAPDGSEAVFLSLGGERSHTVVILVDGKPYRLKSLEKGEVALYDDQGQNIHIKRDGIEVNAKKVTVNSEGDATVNAGGTVDINATGMINLDGDSSDALQGIVQGQCMCAYTGAPHPQVSSNVKATV
ncbi:MAG: phage baseplate assembly protein V [Gammaproteobacteria bacterium]|nr:phage baseplate assembly protein V [Gammaproteobacteria bacterium]